MACACGTKGCGTSDDASLTANKGVKGCKSGGACGCNKMNTFDWLQEMEMPLHQTFEIVEVRFRNGRKEYYRNSNDLDLVTGDAIVVEIAGGGYDLGFVSLQGELVRLQMMKKKIKDNDEIKAIWRLATAKDLEKYEQAAARNLSTLFRTRQIANELKLKMKLSDVDYQADNTKATFYYSAEDRVDFRELIKMLAVEFKIRVEMKQISLRQEAARVGGIGSCGRELCCSTWLTDFKSVPTSAARYQNLSLNPSKLSGQCGRLKCCLNYELDTYTEALKGIPDIETPLKTQKGLANLTKTDIFKKLMWFAYNAEAAWHPLTVERVKEIMEMNAKGLVPFNLQTNEEQAKPLLSRKDMGSSILEKVERQDRFNKNNRNKKRNAEKTQNPNQIKSNENANKGQNPNQNKQNPNQIKNNENANKGQNPNQNKQNPNQIKNNENANKGQNPNQNKQNPNQIKNNENANQGQNPNQNKQNPNQIKNNENVNQAKTTENTNENPNPNPNKNKNKNKHKRSILDRTNPSINLNNMPKINIEGDNKTPEKGE
ncbi:MAG: Signal peptidase-like protein [Bacteroidetes bacterium]|nr:MAG: Signal peptidase-like protein [Bacteroidota bacterium]TAG89535.1 MAG: Signal peptidase-like protein [Bacteroidota bacterium]